MKIAFDFDKTICNGDYNFPQIGKPIPLAITTLKELQNKNTLILNTIRDGDGLIVAVKYLLDNNVKFQIYKGKGKIDADIFIDDKNIGIKHDKSGNCDWVFIRSNLRKLKLIK